MWLYFSFLWISAVLNLVPGVNQVAAGEMGGAFGIAYGVFAAIVAVKGHAKKANWRYWGIAYHILMVVIAVIATLGSLKFAWLAVVFGAFVVLNTWLIYWHYSRIRIERGDDKLTLAEAGISMLTVLSGVVSIAILIPAAALVLWYINWLDSNFLWATVAVIVGIIASPLIPVAIIIEWLWHDWPNSLNLWLLLTAIMTVAYWIVAAIVSAIARHHEREFCKMIESQSGVE